MTAHGIGTGTTRVEFHCHSMLSDGELPPAELADRIAVERVAAAALTDHDTVEGLDLFRQALARHGIGCITGLELSARYGDREVHLLAYGFEPNHPDLLRILRSLRLLRAQGTHGITESLLRKGALPPATSQVEPPILPQEDLPEVPAAIALIHRAGGRAFLAHPLVLEPDPTRLEALLAELKREGLDGVEAIYGPYPEADRESICAMARRIGLLVSAGTDTHGRGSPEPGIDMPTALWKAFRGGVFSATTPGPVPVDPEGSRRPSPRLARRRFFFHVIFPTLLAIGLFIGAIYAVFLPAFERSLMDRKREMIRELASSAWSILAELEGEERAGTMSRERAQETARSRVESLRYGREGKDYFWLQDQQPRILMHPYRKDLNGRDVSDFRDPRGAPIFVEFADLVRRQKEGYLEYVWQWKDDPRRLALKESYVKGFEPWGWVIGTGIYIEDVKQEIARIERNLLRFSSGIVVVVALLLLYVVRQSMRIERERSSAEEGLRESTERYRSLIEATTEGTLLVLDGRCRYANPILLEMLGYTLREIELLDPFDVITEIDGNEGLLSAVQGMLRGEELSETLEGVIRRRDGILLECVCAFSRIAFGEEEGFILLTRDITPHPDVAPRNPAADEERLRSSALVAEGIPLGLFRARATRRGTVVWANSAAGQILHGHRATTATPVSVTTLANLFPTQGDFEEFLNLLRRQGRIDRHVVHLSSEGEGLRTLAVTVLLILDDQGHPRFVDGTFEDITAFERREAEREALLEKMQTSLLFLHEPLIRLGRQTLLCQTETPIRQVAADMTAHRSSAALVRSESGSIVGIVTDHDIRERIVAPGSDLHTPVYKIMSAPIATIPDKSPIFDALLLMEEKDIQHLAVADETGSIVSVVHKKELVQFHRYGSVTLVREIARAGTDGEVVRCCRRTHDLVRALLDCGAHPHNITRTIASICDAATERLAAIAESELGPPPVPYAVLALGSQGRQEQTLFTDQDNAILYELPDGQAEDPKCTAYFVELGKRLCGHLDQAGYPFCLGNVMAQNPKWVKPLAVWKGYFAEWLRRTEPQDLLELSIFFDFRAVHGEARLAHDLRRYLHQELAGAQAFFPHFAQNALLFKPPYWLFGRILVTGAGGDQAGLLNLKDAMMPLVSFARLYALRHRVDETHTLDRVTALVLKNILSPENREEFATAYDSLMRLRLRRQVDAIRAGQPPDNVINPRKLTHFEEIVLKQAFSRITTIQKKISYDFLGGIG